MSAIMLLSTFFQSVSRLLDRLSCWLMTIFMTVMVADVLLGVFNRFLFKMSVSWTEELARFLIVWISMIGAGIAMKKGSHVSISLLISRMGRLKVPVLYFNTAVLGCFLFFIALFGLKLCLSQAGQISPALRVSMFWPLLAVPAGSIIMLFHLLSAISCQTQLLKVNGCDCAEKGNR